MISSQDPQLNCIYKDFFSNKVLDRHMFWEATIQPTIRNKAGLKFKNLCNSNEVAIWINTTRIDVCSSITLFFFPFWLYWVLIAAHGLSLFAASGGISLTEMWRLLFFFSFIFISWRLITSQHFSGFCHTLTGISHGVTCIPHPDPPSHLPLHPIPLGLPSAPGPSTCLMHPAWAGDLFHYG